MAEISSAAPAGTARAEAEKASAPAGSSRPPEAGGCSPLWLRSLLWIGAILLMAAAAVYQRATGPTYPMRGEFTAGGQTFSYELIRSDWSSRTNGAAEVVVPDPGPDSVIGARLLYKRYPTPDEFTARAMVRQEADGGPRLAGRLPAQPAAGKLAYFIELDLSNGSEIRIPEQENVIIRFKNHVPGGVLWPHVAFMFFAVLIGMRAGLGALFAPDSMRLWAWISLVAMTVGGLIFGPIVQKYAFGEYWTGFPFGGDWTDNKMLVMWLAWALACGVIGFRPKRKETVSRAVVGLAALVMTGAYLIPHSMGGSQLDYSKVEQGADPSEAITTGRQ